MTPDDQNTTLPPVRVTLLEDRARVERRGTLALPAGRNRLRLGGVSLLAVDRSLQVEASGATLIETRLSRSWKERPKGGLASDASALRKRVRELEVELARREAEVSRLAVAARLADDAGAEVRRAVAEAAGTDVQGGDWGAQLDRVRLEIERSRAALREARQSRSKAERRLEEAKVALDVAEEPEPVLETAVELLVDVPTAGAIELGVSYLVPCALWRPCYRATLGEGEGGSRVELEAQAMVWQRTGEEWKDVELLFSTARPSLGAEPPRLRPDRLSLRDKAPEERKQVAVEVREEEIQTAGEGALAKRSELPGVDDGGEVQTLTAPGRATIPSDGRPTRIDLFRFDAPAEVERLAAPELSPLVSLAARFDNRSGRVLLAGPVDLVRRSGFVGRGLLKYAAVGERLELGFGSQDTVRLIRQVQESRAEAALTGKRTVTRWVRIFASNAGAEPVDLALEERIPVSELSAVEVKLSPARETPTPNADGILRFAVSLSSHEHRELSYDYQIVAGSKVTGI